MTFSSLVRVATLLGAIYASPVCAETGPASPAPATATAVTPAPAGPFASSTAVAEADLGQITGRENTATLAAIASQQNTVTGNSVSGSSVTGSVHIDGNAFQNLQGLAVISANSGNNVAINSAMNVTINLGPQ